MLRPPVILFWTVSFCLLGCANSQGATVTRGPYLQQGTPTGIIVRWRTDVATDSRVQFGTIQGAPNLQSDDATSTTEHIVALTGLTADTTYYYSVGTSTDVLAGGDATYFFTTS